MPSKSNTILSTIITYSYSDLQITSFKQLVFNIQQGGS